MKKKKAKKSSLLKRLFKLLASIVLAILLVIITILAVFRVQASLREIKTPRQAAPPAGTFIKTADATMYIQEMGPASGRAVVLIHGTAAWSGTWRDTLSALAKAGFHAIALDLPPFGFSEKLTNPAYSRQDQAKRIIGALSALHLQRAILVGHSFGSGATLQAALDAPDKVQALVLVDAALGLSSTGQAQQTDPWLLKALLSLRPLRNMIVASTITNPLLTKQGLKFFLAKKDAATDERVKIYQQPFVVKGTTEAIGDWLMEFLFASNVSSLPASESNDTLPYKNLHMPVLLIWGQNDTVTPLAQGQYLASVIPNAKLKVLKEVGHIPQIEDTNQFNNVLAQFLLHRDH